MVMRVMIFITVMSFLFSCQKDEKLKNTDENIISYSSKVVCDTCQYPIVMVHGFLAAGDTWTNFMQLFHSNGYDSRWIHAFDWNSLAQGANQSVLLDRFIDSVLRKTGRDKVRLMGHSAGGGVCYSYLADSLRSSKVDGYVHIGAATQPAPAGPRGSIATLVLWSAGDKISSGRDITGAKNVELVNKDHYEVATSKEAFDAIYQFFHNKNPKTLTVPTENPVCIVGKMLTFGENAPIIGGTVEIYPVGAQNGFRLTRAPIHVSKTDSLGNWTAVNVDPGQTYEFVTIPTGTNARKIHYFREGFAHLNTLVYLRTLPGPGSIASLLLAGLPNSSEQTVMNVFSSSAAIVNGRDSLVVDGNYISTATFASPAKTAISFFLYDDGDKKTELTSVGLFGTFSFLSGVDVYFPTVSSLTIPVKLNSKILNVPNIPSDQGIVIAVFD